MGRRGESYISRTKYQWRRTELLERKDPLMLLDSQCLCEPVSPMPTSSTGNKSPGYEGQSIGGNVHSSLAIRPVLEPLHPLKPVNPYPDNTVPTTPPTTPPILPPFSPKTKTHFPNKTPPHNPPTPTEYPIQPMPSSHRIPHRSTLNLPQTSTVILPLTRKEPPLHQPHLAPYPAQRPTRRIGPIPPPSPFPAPCPEPPTSPTPDSDGHLPAHHPLAPPDYTSLPTPNMASTPTRPPWAHRSHAAALRAPSVAFLLLVIVLVHVFVLGPGRLLHTVGPPGGVCGGPVCGPRGTHRLGPRVTRGGLLGWNPLAGTRPGLLSPRYVGRSSMSGIEFLVFMRSSTLI